MDATTIDDRQRLSAPQRVVFDSTDPLSTNPSNDITLQHLSNRWMCCIVLCCLPFHPFLSPLVASEDENRLSGDRRLHTRLDWYDWTPTPVLLTPVVKSWAEVYSRVTTNSLNACSSGPHVLTRMTPSMGWKVFTKTSPAGQWTAISLDFRFLFRRFHQ